MTTRRLAPLALAALSAFLAPAAPAAGPPLAFVGVDVLPMDGRGLLRDRTVLVRGDRIAAIGEAGQVTVPPGSVRVDATGKVLIPGLVDMHVHLPPERGRSGDAADRVLQLMVAHGVTTARSLAGHPLHLEVRDKVGSGELLGPTLYLAAPALHDGNTPSAAAAREAVQVAAAAGYDLIKSHALSDPEVWAAVQGAARDAGLPVAGHVTNPVGLERAIAAGQQIEHLDGWIAALLPPDHPAVRGPWGQIPPREVLAAVDRARIGVWAERMAAAGIWSDPTLALFERIADTETSTETLRRDPTMAWVSSAALEAWAGQREALLASGILAGVAKPFAALRREIVAALATAGAPLLAGSDTPQAFLLPGPGLQAEIAALAAAGLGPERALAAATSEPARYLRSLPRQGSATGLAADFGTVAEGARADLVLLDGDPRADLGVLVRPAGVVLRGRWLDRTALDGLLASARPPAPPEPRAEAAPGEVWLVRHGETAAGSSPDRRLSERGRARAEALADRLEEVGVTRILSTDLNRTRQTAAPLAKRLGLEVELYRPDELEALAARLRADGGGAVLVVGHSNTTPELVARLGGEPGPPIAEDEHDRLYRVVLPGGATTRERFGPP